MILLTATLESLAHTAATCYTILYKVFLTPQWRSLYQVGEVYVAFARWKCLLSQARTNTKISSPSHCHFWRIGNIFFPRIWIPRIRATPFLFFTGEKTSLSCNISHSQTTGWFSWKVGSPGNIPPGKGRLLLILATFSWFLQPLLTASHKIKVSSIRTPMLIQVGFERTETNLIYFRWGGVWIVTS